MDQETDRLVVGHLDSRVMGEPFPDVLDLLRDWHRDALSFHWVPLSFV